MGSLPVRQIAPQRPRTAPPKGTIPKPHIPAVRAIPNPITARPIYKPRKI